MRKPSKKKSIESYSRSQARKKIKERINTELPRWIVVHHLDGNPLNNDINNLKLMDNSKHISHHIKGSTQPKRLLKRVEKLLSLYNTSF